MSSTRFPGKVLAPLRGKPALKQVVDGARQVKRVNKVVVLTSSEESDDPLVSYLEYIHCPFFRGSLHHVFDRFQSALHVFPCDYFVRVSADSPFINAGLFELMIQKIFETDDDVISNVLVRTFPKGQSVEIMKSEKFLSVDKSLLTTDEAEHVFPYFYKNNKDYKIKMIKNISDESHLNFCVDTLQDLAQLNSENVFYQFNSEILC